jgi:hypothetical protein
MTYDLRRLRTAGLIRRLPRSNRYTLTADGTRIAIFYTKVYNRLLIPLTAADQPQAPSDLRAALSTIDKHIQDYIAHAPLRDQPLRDQRSLGQRGQLSQEPQPLVRR